jgi:hypothetical protein
MKGWIFLFLGSEILEISCNWPDYEPNGCGLLTVVIFGGPASI